MRVALTYTTFVDGERKPCPFNPIDDFMAWYNYDPPKAKKCLSMLGALEETSYDSTPDEQETNHEQVIDEICLENVTGYFLKYVEEDP